MNFGWLISKQALDLLLSSPNLWVLNVRRAYVTPQTQTLGFYKDIVKCVSLIHLVMNRVRVKLKVMNTNMSCHSTD